MALARTKIEAQRQRQGTIARPKPEQRLDQALAMSRLVLLCAPAGFGTAPR